MSKLEKDLKEWVALGLISSDQEARIREHEAAKPEGSWILSGLLILGAVIIGIGVISLIAANWNEIPNGAKLAGDFILLIALAFAALRSWESKKPIQFEVLLLSFLILCLASIGLIAQIYHTDGKLYQALMLWSLITSGAMLAARQLFVPFMWTGAFLTGAAFAASSSVTLQPIFRENYQAIFMALPLLAAGLAIVSRSLAGETGTTRAFRSWTLIGGLIALVVAELHESSRNLSYTGLTAYAPGYLLAAFTAFSIWQSAEYRNIQKMLLLTLLGVFLIPFHLPLLEVKLSVVYAAFTIVILGLMAVFLASLKERRLFQWLLLALGARFLVLYFEALGGLATTGAGLIVSGGVVIAMTILWNKYRTALAVWAEGWMR